MKLTDVIKLVGYAKSAGTRTPIDAGTAQAWHDLLEDDVESYEEGQAAVKALLKRGPWVEPSAIIAEVKAQRTARLADADRMGGGREALSMQVPCYPDGTPVPADDVAGTLEALRARRTAAASGLVQRDLSLIVGTGQHLALPAGDR